MSGVPLKSESLKGELDLPVYVFDINGSDELGFLSLDADGARLVLQVFADAYERQSVAITTNLEFSRWGSVFGDDQMAAAVIDRIVHHGRLVQFKGESYRVRHALM